ncbi:unnamed protein product [Allacma fusca]|uniref:Uncharacterized protein n=1 Tax=Allacma fusca TaxID=39272 RepID=A0A8J2JZ64_9HEXA|nr:unnamed protein product [Allacma fusca]
MTQKIPHRYKDKEIFYYALVLKQGNVVPEMSIMEFYNRRQDVPQLETILRWMCYSQEYFGFGPNDHEKRV